MAWIVGTSEGNSQSMPDLSGEQTRNVKTLCLLQRLPIPDQAWVRISMYFIDQLPISQGKTMIWVIV